MVAVAAGASLLGTYVAVQGARAQAKGQAAASRYNAAVMDRNAKAAEIDAQWTELTGAIETQEFRDDFDELNKATKMASLKNNWEFSGTAADVFLQNAREADEDIAKREVNIAASSQAFREKGVNMRMNADLQRIYARNYQTAGRYRAAGAAFSGISKTAYMLT